MTRARSVLVTGGSGFIGRRCLPRLVAAGFQVHALSSQGTRSGPEGVRWHGCNLLDPGASVGAIEAIRPTHLLHLAWITQPGKFWSDPSNLAWLQGGVALVDGFFRGGGTRAVGLGTCAEYGWDGSDSDEETSPLHPVTAYGRCKLALGLAFGAAASMYGGSAAWARLFHPYGPGEADEKFIPFVIRGLLSGKVVKCSHGMQVRDFVYVDDVADALLALLESPAQGPHNIGSGAGVTLREVAGAIVARLGHADQVQFGAREPALAPDPDRIVANTARIRRHTGWMPAVALEEGISRSIEAVRAETGR